MSQTYFLHDTHQINFRNSAVPLEGTVDTNLTPIDTVKVRSGIRNLDQGSNALKKTYRVVVGRDARISGAMVQNLVMNTLTGMGIDVIDLDLSTTPTVEIAVPLEHADGGIILTASHNPKQWNALKLLRSQWRVFKCRSQPARFRHRCGGCYGICWG